MTACAALAAAALAGCGSAPSQPSRDSSTTGDPGASGTSTTRTAPHRAHPQAIEPSAGVHTPAPSSGSGRDIVGDPSAHAPSLAAVRRQLRRLNLCGGAVDPSQAAPIAASRAPGFVADPGTAQTQGSLPRLTAALDALGRSLRVTIYGISGYRSPQHSVAVGGFADDPHTRGEAEDIGVGSLLRSSAARISEPELARFGLYRPFDPSGDPGNTEVNHIQLIPRGGPLSLSVVADTYDPDPACR